MFPIIRLISPQARPVSADAVVYFLFRHSPDKKKKFPNALFPPEVKEYLRSGDFTGDKESLAVCPTPLNRHFCRYLFAGLGEKDSFSPSVLRKAAAAVMRQAIAYRWKSLHISSDWLNTCTVSDCALYFESLTEGLLLGAYSFQRYKKNPSHRLPAFSIETGNRNSTFQVILKRVQSTITGVYFCRDLVNTPASDCTPGYFADALIRMARSKKISARLYRAADLKRMKMNGILAVGRGSSQPPCMVQLTYRHPKALNRQPIVLIGKGITFDSGGLNLKTGNFMDQMKMDMSGGACVGGVLQAVAGLKIPVYVVGLIPIAENMPGSCAFKPGDILRMHNGTTVEITNTDAEGRLLLADALSYAQSFHPSAMIDIATLTGACAVALGPYAAGMMGNTDDWKQRLLAAARETDERLWELPLWPELDPTLKSHLADIKNSGSRYGGALFAGAFLQHFTAGLPWVHLDIAGTAYAEEDSPYYKKNEATGFGVRLLTRLLIHYAEPDLKHHQSTK